MFNKQQERALAIVSITSILLAITMLKVIISNYK